MSNSVIKDTFSISTYEPTILNTFTNIAATTVNAYKDENNTHLDLTLGASSNVNIEALNNVRVYFDDQSSLQLFNSMYSNNVRIDTELLDISQSMNNTYIYTSNQPLIISGQDGVHTTQISQTVFTDSNDYQLLQTSQTSGFQLGTQVVLASNLIVDKDIVAYENLALGGNLFVPTMNIYKNTEATVLNNMQNQIAYGFYINEFDQLELIKYNKYTSNLNQFTNISRIATFGSNIYAKVGNLNNYTVMNQFTGVVGSPSNISSNNSGSTVGMTAMGWGINADKKRIYYSDSNVGIYTQDPKYALDVVGDLCASKRIMSMSNIGVGTSNPRAPLHVEGMSYFNGEMRTTGRFMTTSNMGVGSSNPQAQLHVIGNSIFEGDIIPGGNGLYNLGSSNNRFRSLFVTANTVDIDGTLITRNGTDGAISFITSNGDSANINTGRLTIANSNIAFLIDIVDDKLYTYQSNASGLTPVSLIQNISVSESNVGINKAVPTKALDVVGDANLTGSMVIGGDLTVMGNTTTVNTENVLIKDNVITLNSSQTGVPVSTLKSGLEIERGTLPNYLFIFDESVSQFKVGTSNSLNTLVTHDDTLTSGFTYYNSNTQLLTNKDITLSDFPSLDGSIAYGSNLSRDTSNALYPQALFASNSAVWGSNKSVIDSNALYPKSMYASNLVVTSSNALYPQALFASNLVVTVSNEIYPQASFGSNLAVTSSNALYPQAYFASNTGVWGSNLAAVALTRSSNLSDLTNITTAQNNLGLGTSCNVTFSNITTLGDILPTINLSQNIGSSNHRFNNLWVNDIHLGSNTLYLGDTPVLGTSADTILIKADPNQSITVSTSGVGHTQVNSAAGVDINATNGNIITSAYNGSIQLNTVGTNRSIALTADGASSRVSIAAGTEIDITSPNTVVSGNVSMGANLSVTSNLTVTGDLTVMGSNFIANVQTVQIKDNIMLLNYGEQSSGVTSPNGAGIEIDRGDSVKYRLVFKESVQMFVMGAAGNEEIIASQNYVGTNALWKASNLADLTNIGTARNNLALGASCNVMFNNLTVTNATLSTINSAVFVNGDFGSNYAVWSSNKAVDSSNAIFPQALFASNYAVWASNAGTFGSNYAVWASNYAVWASNAGTFGSNYAVWSSNKAVSDSNTIFPQALFASNYAVWASNTGTWASNNLNTATGAWKTNSSYVYITSSNVGIGTTTPLCPIDILGNSSVGGMPNVISLMRAANTTGVNDAGIMFGSINGNTPFISDYSSGISPGIQIYTSNVSRMSITGKGVVYMNSNLGIRTTTPVYPLDVVGDINTSTTLRSVTLSNSGNMQVGGVIGTTNDIVVTKPYNTSTAWLTLSNSTNSWGSMTNLYAQKYIVCTAGTASTYPDFVVGPSGVGIGYNLPGANSLIGLVVNGIVGIGTGSPNSAYKLDVAGDINTSTTLRSVTLSNSGNMQVGGILQATGGSKLVVQNGVDGTSAQGIFTWSTANTDFGIYQATTTAGKSLGNGNATGGAGFTSHAIRFRMENYVHYGFIFENSSEALLCSIRASDGLAYFAGNVGIGTTTPNAQLQLASTTANRKIVLWDTLNNDNQYYGFGINTNMLRYQVDGTTSDHVFYAGTSTTTSTELMRIKGSGNLQVGGSLSVGAVTCTTIVTQNNNINVGTGTVYSATHSNSGNMQVGGYLQLQGATNCVQITNGDPGDMIVKSYGSAGDRYGMGHYTNGVTRIFTSSTYASSSVRLSRPTDDVRTGSAGFTDLLTAVYNGNVGIGTASPAYKLDVAGTARITSTLFVNTPPTWGTGQITNPSWTSLGAAGTAQLITASVATGGNTTAFGLVLANSLQDSVSTLNTLWSPALGFGGGTTGGSYLASPCYIAANIYNGGDGNWRGGDLAFFTAPSTTGGERMRITGGGNVGIGTTNPNQKLEVYTTGGGSYIRVSGDTGQQQALELYDSASRWIMYKPASTTDLRFFGGSYDRVTIQAGGNVGIGTSSPGYKLDVSGDINTNAALRSVTLSNSGNMQVGGVLQATGGSKIVVQNSQDGGSSKGIYMWNSGDNNWGIYMGQSGASKSLVDGNATGGAGFVSHAIRFRVNNSTGNGFIFENSSEALLCSIRASDGLSYFAGSVGIGTTSPGYKLDVAGDIRSTGNILVSGTSTFTGGVTINNSLYLTGTNGLNFSTYGGYFYMSDATWIRTNSSIWANNGNICTNGSIGAGTSSPSYKLDVQGDIRSTGTIYGNDISATSDIRKKKDLEPIQNSLEMVGKLKGTYFKMIENTDNKRKIGLIAQDVLKVVPEVVCENKEGFLSISYGSLVALLIESTKEQVAINETLKSQIATLKSQIATLFNKLNM